MKNVALLYHDVVDGGDFASSGFSGADADIYKLDRHDFRSHLDAIARVNPRVNLTFDDGGASFAHCIADELEERGWRGHFFIATNWIGRHAFLTASHIRELRDRGHRIGTHSCSHPPRLSHCAFADIVHEWTRSAAGLSDILGERIDSGSVPGGFYSPKVGRAAAVAGLQTLFTSEPTLRIQHVDGCTILGRFTIQRGTPAATAAALAGADVYAHLRQSALWNTKKALKALGGNAWLDFRKRMLHRRAA